MPNYAVPDPTGKQIINVIVAENKNLADEVTQSDTIPVLDGKPSLGWRYWKDEGEWRDGQQPYDSWSWNADIGEWVAPVPQPADMPLSEWDEETQSWRNPE